MRFREEFGNHWLCYSELCDLRKSYHHYEEIYEELFEVHALHEFFSQLDFLSEQTKKNMKKFQDQWYQNIEINSFSSDGVFVYLDIKFQSILDNELLNFLVNFNSDLIKAGYKDVEEIEIKEREFPNYDSILRRGEILYNLISEQGKISPPNN